jgi:hypothetical protein
MCGRHPIVNGSSGPAGGSRSGTLERVPSRSELFPLAVTSEMLFLDLPYLDRVRRIAELGFQVEMWD